MKCMLRKVIGLSTSYNVFNVQFTRKKKKKKDFNVHNRPQIYIYIYTPNSKLMF